MSSPCTLSFNQIDERRANRIMLARSSFRGFIRLQSTAVKTAKTTATGLTKAELANNKDALQAPNKAETWSATQASRIEVIAKNPVRFTQKDLSLQPQPYAAIELIGKEPVRYLDTNIAVCDGNKGSTLQGHPKVYINLDQPKASTCGYCGLRYAKKEFKELIEGSSA